MLLIASVGLAEDSVIRQEILAETDGLAVKKIPADNPNTAVIINNSDQVEQRPTSYVEATPLRENSADRLRKSRTEIEQKTEQRIAEKLEQERIEEERKRAERTERMFDRAMGYEGPVAAPAPAPAPAPVIVPTIVQREETVVEDPNDKSKFYISALGGMGDYPNAKNVKGQYATGFSVGVAFPERLLLEGGYVYSLYDIDSNNYYGYATRVEMKQNNFNIALKYQILPRRVRPVIGVLGTYNYRSFAEKQTYYFSTGRSLPNSYSIDAGLLAGVDVMVSESFVVGVDVRYLMNLSTRRDDQPLYYYPYTQAGTPIEEISYYIFSLNGAFRF